MTPSGALTPIVCLLPARNAAAHLDDWLESAGRFADAVVALDDGSEDDTARILRGHPLVARVLENPRRSGYAGWDDAANRARLLDAARDLDPAWIMQLDADERVTSDDADALRAFLLGGADRGFAYSFAVLRMVGDRDHYDADRSVWVCRCFAYDANHHLPTTRLHFVPVPSAFPPARQRRTTFRIQHLVGLTEDDRRRQFDKYREADPDRRFQAGYEHLLRPPDDVRRWAPRSPALHALANEPAPRPVGTAGPPMMSAVVVDAEPDRDAAASEILARAGALLDQDAPSASEVLVVLDPDHAAAATLRTAHPGIRVVVVDAGTSAAAARDTGFGAAAGRYLVCPRGRAAPGYTAALLRLHTEGFALVADALDTDAVTAAGVALHVLEHWDELPGPDSRRLPVPPPCCSVARDAWTELGDADEPDRGMRAMHARGYSVARAGDAVIVVPGRDLGVRALVTRCFARGRDHGRVVARAHCDGRPRSTVLLRATAAGPVPARRVVRALRAAPPDLRRRVGRAAPLVVLGALATWAGGACGVARGVLTGTDRVPGRRRSTR